MQFNYQDASYTTQTAIAPTDSSLLSTQSMAPTSVMGGVTIAVVLALMIASGFSAAGFFSRRPKLTAVHS